MYGALSKIGLLRIFLLQSDSKWQAYMQEKKTGDNSILVWEGLKMQKTKQNQTVANKIAEIHSAIPYILIVIYVNNRSIGPHEFSSAPFWNTISTNFTQNRVC